MGPERFDVLIVGAGTAGCVLAARLSEDPAVSVCLVEAGPDYGPYDAGRWPPEILDARAIPVTHDWGLEGDASLLRARIVGGCSAHNACFVVWGARDDYDEWAAAYPEWSFAALEPCLRLAENALATRIPESNELSAFHQGVLEAAATLGIPRLDNFNDLDAGEGIAPIPLNAHAAVRWNTAFAYLDPARQRPNLRVLGDTLVDRILLEGARSARGAFVRGADGEQEISAGLVVLAAGAYESPAILLRSGIGPDVLLRELAIEPVVTRDGVGANLIDHPGVTLFFEPGAQLRESLAAQHAAGLLFQGQCAIRASSRLCPGGLWDLQLLPWASPTADEPVEGPFETHLSVFAMKPASRGRVTLRSPDPEQRPRVEQRFLSDPEGHDLTVLLDAVARARELVRVEPLASALDETGPAASLTEHGELEDWARESARGFFHPVGTCAMGRASDPASVVDGAGRVHGVADLHVADASVMPSIPRANTNLPTAAVAERLAALIAGAMPD